MRKVAKTGAVFAIIPKSSTSLESSKILTDAMSRTPEGRHLIVLWSPVGKWGPAEPVEALATEVVLNCPSDRTESNWEFFGNGITRCYRSKSTDVANVWSWLIFRRAGAKPYSRKNEVSERTKATSTLDTLNKVFTRDVANNVWHMPVRSGASGTIRRLQSLLTWSDETIVVVSKTRRERRPFIKQNHARDLIGVAVKVPYSLGEVQL